MKINAIMEENNNKELFTVTVFSENRVGLLNQISIIFTRRKLNIESLSVSPSSIKGVHKFTITAYADETTIAKLVQQVEKRIDVLKSFYYRDDEIVYQEVALYKLSTPVVLENPGVSSAVRHHGAQIVEVNPTYTVVSKRGMTEDIMSLYYALNDFNCVLQYVRSGRIAITKSCTEYLDEFLEERRKSYEALQKK